VARDTTLLQGTLDLLILKTLTLEKLHGLGIARRIEQITRGAFEVKPGSLKKPGGLLRCGASQRAAGKRVSTCSLPPAAGN